GEQGGLDGIFVVYNRTHCDSGGFQLKIWCPSKDPLFSEITKILWDGLHDVDEQFDAHLERLHSYFDEWGPPVFKTREGAKISGMLSTGDEPHLQHVFDHAGQFDAPRIDMRNFDNMGTLLLPIFERFHRRRPKARWVLNDSAQMFLGRIGIENSG
ncbi:MAG: hypothetical protein AAF585_14180, partial [Verrucomicrobiota bacterium]